MQLRDRQIAEEKKVTYGKQQSAAESEKSLREAEATAAQQAFLTKSKIQIEIEGNAGAALASKAEQEANQIVALAKANNTRIRLEGEAEASKESNVGLAKAQAIDAQVKAYGGAEFRIVQEVTDKLSDAIKNTKVDIVPKTVVNMGGSGESGNGGTGTVLDALLKFITLDKLGVNVSDIAKEAEAKLAAKTAAAQEAPKAPKTKDAEQTPKASEAQQSADTAKK
jgi:hypothetical protein